MGDQPLSRENILEGHIQELARAKSHALRVMTDEERHEIIKSVMNDAPADEPLRVFAYGSLIWNPAMHIAASYPGKVSGYRRRFCFWTVLGRGCENNPGLMLGLEEGEHCDGLVYEIAEEHVETEMDILFRREMVSYAYKPLWLDVECDTGSYKALTFVMDIENDRYCGDLDHQTRVKHIATAEGYLGHNSQYLFDLVDHLHELDINDEHIESLARDVREYQQQD